MNSDARLLTLALLLALTCSAPAATPAPAQVGARIFLEGSNARGEAVRALVGMPPTPLNGEPAACSACHARGSNGSQPAAAPTLRWPLLARDQSGALRYSEVQFARAVSEGVGPAGAVIGAAMPRYALSRSEIAALIAYLKSMPVGGAK